jgi:hypothetical protein
MKKDEVVSKISDETLRSLHLLLSSVEKSKLDKATKQYLNRIEAIVGKKIRWYFSVEHTAINRTAPSHTKVVFKSIKYADMERENEVFRNPVNKKTKVPRKVAELTKTLWGDSVIEEIDVID